MRNEEEVWIITTLDEFLDPLHHGVWEVIVLKKSVTEPLDSGCVKSPVNVPSQGTIASYRKGQYHAHEQETDSPTSKNRVIVISHFA